MELMRYREEYGGARPALIMKQGRKWMTLLVVDNGRLKTKRVAATDAQYLSPIPTNYRKARASWRRMAKKKGTSRAVRNYLKESL
jgi:hypothetical protein